MGAWSGGAEAQGQARVQVQARAAGTDSVRCERGPLLRSMRGWGRAERVEPRVGGLRWHAMRVGRLPRSTEGVGAESHRVTGSQCRRFEGSRAVAESISQRISQRISRRGAGWWRRGTNGAARLTCADTTCDETMVAWQAASRRQVWRRQAGRQAWPRQAWREARWARRWTRGGTWVGVASMMRMDGSGFDEGRL
eukprot:scaffold37830_cov55-Phaeocystis_antarctica.AAC.3